MTPWGPLDQKIFLRFLPVIGHTVALVWNYPRILDWIVDTSNYHKQKAWYFQILFESPSVYIYDPKSLEYVLKDNFENYVKGSTLYDRMHDVLGNGIFNVDGEQWKVQRKTAANIFSVKNFREFVNSVFSEEMDHFHEKLSKLSKEGSLVDIQELFFRFTLDGFVKIGFDYDLHCIKNSELVPFASSFDRAQNILNYRFFSPFWKLEEMFLPVGKQMQADTKVIKDFSREIIAKRKAEVSSGNFKERFDLLSLFLALEDEQGNRLYDDNELGDVVINFIIAGRDTTAQALSWTFYLLAKHPQYKKDLFDEIDSLVGKGVKPTYDQVKELKFTKAVFFEVLRLYPSVPKNMKLCVADDVLPNGAHIPAGANIFWSPYAMGRNKEIWGEDAAEFKPHRWLKMEHMPSPFEFPAFHAGPRTCLGKTMAELEGVFVLASFFSQFDYEASDLDKVTYAPSLTLPMKNGLSIKIVKRTF